MTSTTMQSQGFAPARPQAVGEALRELSAAAQRVVTALWASLQRHPLAGAPLSPAEEAAQVREMAGSYARTDPGFAADLYAAADRYERMHSL